jgi:putative chitinase
MAGSSIKQESAFAWLSGWNRQLSDPRSRLGGGKVGLYELASTPQAPAQCLCLSPQAPAARYMDIVGDTVQRRLVLTEDLLRATVPSLNAERAGKVLAPLNLYLNRYEINTVRRLAAFLGQVIVESTSFSRVTEGLYYSSAERLHAVFPSKFPTVKSAEGYTKNPEKLANHVYANKLGNGDEAGGEGWKYRGRGLIQLTGKANYEAFQKATGIDVVTSPELLEQPGYAVYSATWFWHSRGLNGLADSQSYLALTKRINAPALHFSEREAARKHAEKILERAQLYGQGVATP